MSALRTAGVIGAGAWGTALAQICIRGGLATRLWAREPEVVQSITERRENTLFLPGVELDPALEVTGELADLGGCDLILSVAPAQHTRAALKAFSAYARAGVPIVLCSKGVERGTLELMTTVLDETIPWAVPAVLSGPSFAGEAARGLPVAVTLACPDAAVGQALAEALAGPTFRPYLSDDLVGAEIGGSLKNVLAIACGISEGREMGRSAHAALITRGFSEMVRTAEALGGKAATVAGLCGLGDLVLTCSSPQSRNMSVGLALGRGMSLAEALSGKLSVAEGVESAPAVRELIGKLGVDAPICQTVAAILAGEIGIDKAMQGLLARPLKSEW